MKSFNRNDRQDLDVNLFLVIVITVILSIGSYLVVYPFKNQYIGVLLYERGITQHLAILFASYIIATTFVKYIKLQLEFNELKHDWIPEGISFQDYQNPQLTFFCEELNRSPSIIAVRCSRIILAYIHSGSRKSATELAIDDSSFYLSASESSYVFPRILVWAIPLLGFIGTLLGISQAISGFTGFLENTAEIDQIKEGIGIVTNGLAVAFDTTLLALALSIMVMIPLVLVEKLESRLLLQIDVFIQDELISRLNEPTASIQVIQRNTESAIEPRNYEPRIYGQNQSYDMEKGMMTLKEIVDNALRQNKSNTELLLQPVKELLPSLQELIRTINQSSEISSSLLESNKIVASTVVNIEENMSNIEPTLSFLNQHIEIIKSIISNIDENIPVIEPILSRINENTHIQELSIRKLETTALSIRDSMLLLEPILQNLSPAKIEEVLLTLKNNSSSLDSSSLSQIEDILVSVTTLLSSIQNLSTLQNLSTENMEAILINIKDNLSSAKKDGSNYLIS